MPKQSRKVVRKIVAPIQGKDRVARRAARKTRELPEAVPMRATTLNAGQSARKTIEVPEHYFHKVKVRAAQRRIKEKTLWAEILAEYFENHADG